LLADAESTGAHVIAAEPGNYFTPGVPMTDSGACAFFQARGYIENRWTYNLDADLTTLPATPGDVRRPLHEESDRVLEFVEREFGAIWRFEASKAFERELPVAVISEENGGITGFAVHDVNNRGLGFFGPTGVAKSMRGRGIGGALLIASLHDMRRLGFVRAVIPWTDALAFYKKVIDAEPAHRFVTYAKEL
jgi:GNAT superfamily N-acetyltransferase